MQRIADKVFMLTPRNVELSAEERARLIEKGFFNQADGAVVDRALRRVARGRRVERPRGSSKWP